MPPPCLSPHRLHAAWPRANCTSVWGHRLPWWHGLPLGRLPSESVGGHRLPRHPALAARRDRPHARRPRPRRPCARRHARRAHRGQDGAADLARRLRLHRLTDLRGERDGPPHRRGRLALGVRRGHVPGRPGARPRRRGGHALAQGRRRGRPRHELRRPAGGDGGAAPRGGGAAAGAEGGAPLRHRHRDRPGHPWGAGLPRGSRAGAGSVGAAGTAWRVHAGDQAALRAPLPGRWQRPGSSIRQRGSHGVAARCGRRARVVRHRFWSASSDDDRRHHHCLAEVVLRRLRGRSAHARASGRCLCQHRLRFA
mmetsp:Transcript_104415/g.290819  ORF Transcript_104415/g.290819 Transcript_104415/m.290819 type:complete len:310 (-) Transcript_104415:499-1428(-)